MRWSNPSRYGEMGILEYVVTIVLCLLVALALVGVAAWWVDLRTTWRALVHAIGGKA